VGGGGGGGECEGAGGGCGGRRSHEGRETLRHARISNALPQRMNPWNTWAGLPENSEAIVTGRLEETTI